MVCELHAQGRTVWDLLDEASERFGHFASSQVVVRLDSPAQVAELADWVRHHPPSSFDGIEVARVRDLLMPGEAEVPANVLAYDLVDGSRVPRQRKTAPRTAPLGGRGGRLGAAAGVLRDQAGICFCSAARLALMPASTFSAVAGSDMMRTPTAS